LCLVFSCKFLGSEYSDIFINVTLQTNLKNIEYF
jgi:hypothetical protein